MLSFYFCLGQPWELFPWEFHHKDRPSFKSRVLLVCTYFPFHHVHLLRKSVQIWWIPAMAIGSTSLSDSSRGDVPYITPLDNRRKCHGKDITCSVNCVLLTRSEPWTPLPTSVLTRNVCRLIWNCGSCRFNNPPLKIFKMLKQIKSSQNWTSFFSIYPQWISIWISLKT